MTHNGLLTVTEPVVTRNITITDGSVKKLGVMIIIIVAGNTWEKFVIKSAFVAQLEEQDFEKLAEDKKVDI